MRFFIRDAATRFSSRAHSHSRRDVMVYRCQESRAASEDQNCSPVCHMRVMGIKSIKTLFFFKNRRESFTACVCCQC